MSTQPPGKPKTVPQIVAIKQYVEARQGNLERVVSGTGLDLNRFLQLALNQTLRVPDLLACSKESWFDALQMCATHGLLPDGIHGALVPYKGKATFQPMYQGLVQRAYQTRMVTKVWAEVVYEGEQFEVVLGMDPTLRHTPKAERGNPTQLVACYACAKVNGETHFSFLYPQEVARHKASSKTASRSDSPWNTHPAEMWKKTAIIVLSKTLPHFHADASKFASLVDETERQEREGDIIDVSFMDVQPSTPEATVDKAKEELRARQESKAEPPKPTPREPGQDDAPCDHSYLKTLTTKGTGPVTCSCGVEFSVDELRDFQLGGK